MSHGLAAMAPSGFLSHSTKCAESQDLRLEPLDVRKATLATVLARAAPSLRLNEHMEEEDGPLLFQHACKLGLEGIVSKRRDSSYRFGRSPDWIKSKNTEAPAVRREAKEEWGQWSARGSRRRDNDGCLADAEHTWRRPVSGLIDGPSKKP
jgi:hypothetical protein